MPETHEISKIEPQRSTEVATTPGASILSIIATAAANPAVDPDKMQRLLDMHRQVRADEARRAYADALADMQPDLPVIPERGGIKDRSGNVQSRYALWEDINELIRPVLARHGFSLSFRCGREDGQIVVTGVLMHRDGHAEETTIHLPHDASGSKNAVQAVGSSTSYGKRYTAQALLNLTSRGEDDDGIAGGNGATVSADQLDELRALIDDAGGNVRAVCEFYKIDALANMPAATFDRACKALKNKAAQRKAGA